MIGEVPGEGRRRVLTSQRPRGNWSRSHRDSPFKTLPAPYLSPLYLGDVRLALRPVSLSLSSPRGSFLRPVCRPALAAASWAFFPWSLLAPRAVSFLDLVMRPSSASPSSWPLLLWPGPRRFPARMASLSCLLARSPGVYPTPSHSHPRGSASDLLCAAIIPASPLRPATLIPVALPATYSALNHPGVLSCA